MFSHSLCTIAWRWKQPQYPSKDDELIMKIQHVYTVEQCSYLEQNEIINVADK